jgi:hypothetical protein
VATDDHWPDGGDDFSNPLGSRLDETVPIVRQLDRGNALTDDERRRAVKNLTVVLIELLI